MESFTAIQQLPLVAGSLHSPPSSRTERILKKIKRIALAIFLILATVALLYTNPNFLVLGVFLGVAAPKEASDLVNRVKKIWISNNYLYLGIIGLALILAFPAGLAGVAAFTGAFWGKYLVDKGDKSEASTDL